MKSSAALVGAKAAGAENPSTTIISSTAPTSQAPANPIEVFTEQCAARALLFAHGALPLHEAVDELQASAERNGLIGRIGQDRVQAIMGAAFAAVRNEPEPKELPPPEPAPPSCQTPNSTIAAFWYVVSLNDPDRLKAWLADHPADVATLRQILDGKR